MIKIIYFSKLASIFLVSLSLASCATAKNNGLTVSKVEIGGMCNPIDISEDDAGQEAITEVLVGIVAESVVNAGVSFVAGWLKDFEDGYKGSDTASNISAFYCKIGEEGEAQRLGVYSTITYTRTKLGDENPKPHIKLVSKLKYFIQAQPPKEKTTTKKSVDKEVNYKGVFTITPVELIYKDNIAKRGDEKDLTVTYSFEFYDDSGKTKKVAVEPLVFKSVEAGKEYKELNNYMGSRLVGAMPAVVRTKVNVLNDDYLSPFKLKVELAETSVGNGEKLAGEITKKIGESIEKNKDSLAEKILDDWLDIERKEDEDEKKVGGN